MSRTEIEGRLKNIIRPYVQNQDAFDSMTADTDMLRDLQVNSAHLVDIILDMEDEFDIEIDDETATNMLTVGEALEVTERLVGVEKEVNP